MTDQPILDDEAAAPPPTAGEAPGGAPLRWLLWSIRLFAAAILAYTSLGLRLALQNPHDSPGHLFAVVTLALSWILALVLLLFSWAQPRHTDLQVMFCILLALFVLGCVNWPDEYLSMEFRPLTPLPASR